MWKNKEIWTNIKRLRQMEDGNLLKRKLNYLLLLLYMYRETSSNFSSVWLHLFGFYEFIYDIRTKISDLEIMVAECRLEKSYRRFFKENICYIRLFYQRKNFFFNFLYNNNIEKKNKSLQRSTPETSKQPHKRRLIVYISRKFHLQNKTVEWNCVC